MALRAISTGSSRMLMQSSAVANRFFRTLEPRTTLLQHLIRSPQQSMALRAISTASSPMLQQSSAIANHYFRTRNQRTALLQHLNRSPPSLMAVRAISTASRGLINIEKQNLGVKIVPENKAFVIERLCKYSKTLTQGTHFLIPLVDRIAYVIPLEEMNIPIPDQTIMSDDRVEIIASAVLYVKVVDPKLASYAFHDPLNTMVKVAQSIIQSEISKITLDKTLEETNTLKEKIREAINNMLAESGFVCLRCEIHPREVQGLIDELQAFCIKLSKIRGVADLFRLLKKKFTLTIYTFFLALTYHFRFMTD